MTGTSNTVDCPTDGNIAPEPPAPAREIPAELLRGEGSTDAVPAVLDDLSLTIKREQTAVGDDASCPAAIWVGRLRRIVRAKLGLFGLSELADDAQLVVSELVTNGLRYGTGDIGFRLVITTGTLVVQVDDGSPGRPEVRQADPGAENGRGLFLVDALATAWGVSQDGTRTWCLLTPPPDAPGQIPHHRESR